MVYLFYVPSSASRGFNMIFEQWKNLSMGGWIVFGVLLGLTIIASASASRWFPKMVTSRAGEQIKNIQKVAVPQIGAAIPFIEFLLILPFFGLFSSSADTWWIFLIFGWFLAGVILYYIFGIRQSHTALIQADGEWYISGNTGLLSWENIKDLEDVEVRYETMYSTPVYVVTYTRSSGNRRIIRRLPLNCYPESSRRVVTKFATAVKEQSPNER